MDGANILIVEDKRSLAGDIKNRLQALGYRIAGVAASGAQALKKVETLRPDLVLVDIALKGKMDGIETARQIRHRHHLPVVYLTAEADPAILEKARTSEPFGYIPTPFDDRQLHVCIETALQRHELEARLRQSEERYRSLFENHHVVMLLIDPETAAIVDANPAACAFYGRCRAELVRMKITDINSLPRERVFAEMQRALTRRCDHFKFQHRVAGGQLREVEVYSNPITIGERAYLLSIIHDMTERNQTLRALEESEKRFRLLAENAQDIVYRYQFVPERRFEYVSPAATRMTGYTPEEHYADPDLGWKILEPEDRSIMEAAVASPQTLNQPILLRWRRKDGTLLWMEQQLTPQYDAAGTLVAIEGIARDITARRQAEEERQVFAQLSLRLAGATTLRDVALGVREESERLFGWDAHYLSFRFAGEDTFRMALFVDTETEKQEYPAEDFPVARVSEAVRPVLDGKPVLINRRPGEATPVLHRFGSMERLSASLMFAPIRSGTAIVGIVSVQSYADQRYSANDLERLQRFADVVAPALERVGVEAKLKETSETLQAMIQASPLPIIRLDPRGIVQMWNPAAERTFGWTAEEALHRRLPFVPPGQEAEFDSLIEATGRGEIIHGLEIRRTRKDGSEVDLSLSTAALHDARGNFIGPMGILEDITARKRTGEELRLKALLLDNAHDSIFLHDLDGNFIYANEATWRTHGYAPQEILAMNVRDLDTPEYARLIEPRMKDLIENGEATFESAHRRKDGSILPVEVHARFIESGGRRLILSAARDISKRKQAEQLLRAGEESERQFAAHLRALHEIRNQLTRTDSLDDVFRRAVELGCAQLGFERLAIWLVDRRNPEWVTGTWGIDEQGNLCDQRTTRLAANATPVMEELILRKKHMEVVYDTPLCDDQGQPLRKGVMAAAAMWDGEQVIGVMIADNLLHDRPIAGRQCETLLLFANTLGLLCTRKRAMQELQESRAQFQELFDDAPVGYHELDAEGRVVRINRTELAMLGYAADEVLGRPIWEFIAEAEVSRRAFRAKIAGIVPLGVGFERTFRRKDGTLVPVLVSEKPLRDPTGRIVGLRITNQDITDRKRAEEALRDALLRFEWVIEKTPLVAIQGIDRHGVIQHWNGASERLYGYAYGEVAGKRMQDLILPSETQTAFEEELEELWTTGQSRPPQEWPVRTREGGERWVLSAMFPVLEGGQIVEVFCMDVDVTERRAAETALKYRLELEQIISTISASFVQLDLDEIDLGLCGALQTIGEFLGADRGYIFLLSSEGKTVSNTHEWCAEGIAPQQSRLQELPVDSFPWFNETIRRQGVLHIPRVADLPPEAAEKQEFDIQGIQSLICIPMVCRGQFYGFLGLDAVRAEKTWSPDSIALLKMMGEVFVTVLERKQAEQAARHSRMVTEAVANATLSYLETGSVRTMAQVIVEQVTEIAGAQAGIIITLDADNRPQIVAVSNRTWEVMTGGVYDQARRQIEEKGAYRLSLGENLVSAPLTRGVSILTNSPREHPFWGGTMLEWHPPIESFLGVPMKVGKEPLGMIALGNRPGGFSERELRLTETFANTAALAMRMARSEEDRKRAEEQLRHAMKMEAVGRLAGGIAHDFNNLLTAIIGYADLGINSVHPAERVHRYFGEVQQAANRAADLTRQLLAFSRRQPLEPRVINLNDVLMDMGSMLRRLISEDVELAMLPAANLGSVRVDPAQLEQVIVNLAVNARDAMPNGGRLTLETANVHLGEDYIGAHRSVVPGDYILLVVSDTGVGMTEAIKAHLFEPFFTTKEVGKGTGLGLATCYGIVKQSGGYIWAYSEPGHGTTFRIYLPRVAEAPTALPQRDASGYLPPGDETILLVEDEESVRILAYRILGDLGYTIMEAANGEDALRVANEHGAEPIHLLLTDVVMPQMGGKSLAHRLRERWPQLKVLFMSGYSEEGVSGLGASEAGMAFLQKPFTPGGLARKIRDTLDAASPGEPV